jgi:hypothetical protein
MSSIPVTNLDFLPADFRAKQRQRRARRGRWVIAAAFLLLAFLGFAGNHLQSSRLHAELERLKPQAAGVANWRSSLGQLTQQIQQLELHADVRSRLRLRPASTRLLASVTAAMPDDLTLQELEIRNEQPIGSFAAPSRNVKKDDESKPREQLDLDRLISDQNRQIVTLRGFAPDDATVSDYLVRLRETKIFDEVTLMFTDHFDREGTALRTFSVRLRVRPATDPVVANADPKGSAS